MSNESLQTNHLVYSISYTLDYQLNDYFKALQKYLKESDYYNLEDKTLEYNKRTDGIKDVKEIESIGMMTVALARKVHRTTISDYPINCPLCLNLQSDKMVSPFNLERGLLWRNFIISPNGFPYFKVHFLLQASDHIDSINRGTQSEVHRNPHIIEDVLTFAKIIGKGTILFNGWVGNSLGHLHFHYTDTEFPIKTKFKSYSLMKKDIITKNNSTVQMFKDTKRNCKNFILIKGGDIDKVANDTFKFLQYLNSEKLFYNLLIYHNKDISYVYIFIRRKTDDKLGFNFGAPHLGGIISLNERKLKMFKENEKEFISSIEDYCSESVVKFDYKLLKKLF
jgi:hypothetical protein